MRNCRYRARTCTCLNCRAIAWRLGPSRPPVRTSLSRSGKPCASLRRQQQLQMQLAHLLARFRTSVTDAPCISNYSDYLSAKAHTCRCRISTSTDPGARSASFRCASCAAAPKTNRKSRTTMSYRFAIQLYVQNLTPWKPYRMIDTYPEPVNWSGKRGVAQIERPLSKEFWPPEQTAFFFRNNATMWTPQSAHHTNRTQPRVPAWV